MAWQKRKPRINRIVRKRRPARKRVAKRVVPRGLRQTIVPMQREKTIFVNSLATLPTGWAYGNASGYHTIQCSQSFTMDLLPDITEFAPVFKSYKLNCVMVTIRALHNSSMFTSGSAVNYYGGNLICYAQKNLTGTPLDSAITQDYWDQNNAKITKLITGNGTIRFKVYPKIQSETYITAVSATNAQRKPSWIATSTAGLSVPHYGLNMQFSLTDPTQVFSNSVVPDNTRAPINFRVTYKYLFQLRGVH